MHRIEGIEATEDGRGGIQRKGRSKECAGDEGWITRVDLRNRLGFTGNARRRSQRDAECE